MSTTEQPEEAVRANTVPDNTVRDGMVLPNEPIVAPDNVTPVGQPGVEMSPLEAGAAQGFRERWRDVQAGFVDDPARAVRDADLLMDEVLDALAEHKRGLATPTADTEVLRQSLQRYRAMLDRLLPA